MSNQVEEFQKNFVTVVEDTAYLLDDDQFKKDNGFSFTEYISKGNLNNISELGKDFNLVLIYVQNIVANLNSFIRKIVWAQDL